MSSTFGLSICAWSGPRSWLQTVLWIAPGGFGVRFDSHVHEGYVVSPYYDSMIGKLIVHQPTRPEAIACMKRAIGELHIEGIKTTIPLLQKIHDHSSFHEASVDTTFIERTWPS